MNRIAPQVEYVGYGGVVRTLEAELTPAAGEGHGEQGEQVAADPHDDVDGLRDDVEGYDGLRGDSIDAISA